MKFHITAIAKTSSPWDSESGRSLGKESLIISEENLGTFPSLKEALSKLHDKYDFPKEIGEYLAIENGRLTTNRVEDANGNELSENEQKAKGKDKMYLSDFDVYIEVIKEAYEPSVDDLVKLGALLY